MAQLVFEYKGKFDVSDIVSSLKTLRAELGKSVTSESGGKMLSGIDKLFEKIAQDVIKMQSSLEKGFSSTSEVKAFEKELNKMYDSLLLIKNNMANIANTEIKINTKGAKKEFEDLEKEIKKIKDLALKDLLKIIDESVAKDKVLLKSRAKTGELTKESLQSEIDKREENIKKEQEEILVLKDKYKQEKENKALEDALRLANSRNITTKTKLEENFSLIPRRGSTDPRMRAQGLREGTYSQSEFNDSAAKEINRLYKESLKEAFLSSQDVTSAIDIFKNKLAEFGVELKVTKDLQSAFSFAMEAMATKYNEGIKKVDNLTEAERNSIKTHSKKIEAFEEENNSLNDIINGLNNYESEITNANAKLTNFSSTADKNNDALELTVSNLDKITPSVLDWGNASRDTTNEIKETISYQERMNLSFDNIKNAAISLLSIGNIYLTIRQEVTKTYEDIKSLDLAFGQIAMVTDFTLQDMWNKYDAYAQIANEMGQTTLSVVQASGLYFQQGLDEAEALELTASTMKLATLAGLDFEQATSLMTSAVRGFHMEMSEGEHVTDAYSELAANAAASVDDIATAMSRTAAIANSAGMEFETTSAMLTTMIEATQESPETLGTAMKTVIARFTELKENVSLVDSEFEDLDYNKVDKALKSIGVALKDTNGQFRDIDDVFLEVADKWDTLDRNTQRYIATTAAGSRLQSRFIALMENSARVHELLETAQNSTGRSTEQFAKYADTLENKVNRLKNSWEQFKISIIDSEFITGGIDLLNSLVSKMSKVDKGILLSVSAVGVVLGKKLIEGMSNSLKTLNGLLTKSWGALAEKLTKSKNSVLADKYSEQWEDLVNEEREINKLLEKLVEKEKKALEELKKTIEGIETLLEAIDDINNSLNDGGDIESERIELLKNKIESMEGEKENLEEELKLAEERLKAEQDTTAEINKRKDKNSKELEEVYNDLEGVTNPGSEADKQREAREAMVSFIGTAISSALLAGITTFFTTKDATEALKVAGITIGTTIAPVAIEALMTKAVEKIAGSGFATSVATALGPVVATATPVLIGVVVAAAVAGIAYFIAWYYSEELKLKRKIMQDKKELERLSALSSDRESKAEKAGKEYNDLTAMYEKWKELNDIKIKSTKQQEELNNLNDELAQNYPDLVKNYNAETHELELLTNLLEELLKKLKEKKLLTEQESILSNARTAALKVEWETDKKREELLKKTQDLTNYGIGANPNAVYTLAPEETNRINYDILKTYASNSKKLEEALGRKGTAKEDIVFENFMKSYMPDVDLEYLTTEAILKELKNYIKKYDDAVEKKKELDEEIANSETKKWDAILDIQEESLKKYYGNNESVNAIINITRENAKKGIENLANLSMEDKDLAALTYKNVSGYVTKDMFDEFGTGIVKDFDYTKTGMSDFIKVLADYNNMKLKDYQEYIKNSKLTWNQLWEDYKEAIITGYMSAKPQEIIDKIGEEGANTYNDFIKSLSNLSGKELRKVLKENELINLGIPQELIGEAQEAVSKLISENRKQRFKLSDILGIDIDADSFSGEISNTIDNAFKQIAEYNKDPEQYLKEIGTLFNKTGLNSSQIAQALQIDFTDVDLLNLEGFKEESIEFLKSIGVEGAEGLFDSWLTTAQEYSLYDPFISLSDIGEEGGLSELFTKESDAIKGIISDLNTWVKDAGVGGIVEVDDIDKIKEIGDTLGVDTSEMYKFDEATGKWKLNVKDVYNLVLNNSKKYLSLIDDSIAHYEELNKTATPEEKELNNILIDVLKEFRKEIEETLNSINAQTDDYEDLTGVANNFNNGLKALISTYKTLSEELLENGHVSADSIASLEETLKSINSIAKGFKDKNFKVLDASAFLEHLGDSIVFTQNKLENYIDEMIKAAEKTLEFGDACDILSYYQLVALKESFHETAKQIEEDNKEKILSAYEEWQEALDKVREKQEAVAEAEEEVIEKEEELIEKQEELQKLYYGEENHKNQNDYLYNYNTELEQLELNAKKAKEALDNLKPDDDVHQKVQDYVAALREEVTNYKALNEVIKQYMENQKRMLDEDLSLRLEQLKAEGAVDTSTNVSDFYYERNGRFYIDYSKLNAAKLPDDVSDFIEQQVENLNKYSKVYEDNLDKIETALKEFLDWQKAARDKLIATENKVIEILKKKDLEELNNLKDKYEGMKAADDDYTSALEESIKKQRDLRNLASQWDDLAEKEKKLSLLQRDTSGANAKEIQKTQEDIAKTRESLLDDAVDNIINNLKELYEEQEETRQAEIEYRLAILDNKDYNEAALDILSMDKDDFIEWMKTVNEDFNKGSDATKAKMIDDWTEIWLSSLEYSGAMSTTWEDASNLTSEEIEGKVRETSETLTSESERALDETMDKVHEAQEKGREEVEEAKKAVEDAKNKVVEATRAVAEALEEAKKKLEAYNEAIRNQPVPGGGGNVTPGYTDDDEAEREEHRNRMAQLLEPLKKEGNYGKFAISTLLSDGDFNNVEELISFLLKLGLHGANTDKEMVIAGQKSTTLRAAPKELGYGYTFFALGGLVNYTGPAWVDGTPSKPEAFLSASDTEMIREFIDLQKLTFTRPSTDSFTRTNNYGDPVFNIDINVDSISSDYDVDRLVERVHEDILSITSAPGQSVILSK